MIFHSILQVYSQNHIKNGSFENMFRNGEGQFPHSWPVKNCYHTTGSHGYTVYFNSIYNDSSHHWICGVPHNYLGFQYARTGSGYTLVGGNPNPILVFPLSQQLIHGNCYNVRYFVSLQDRSYCAMDAIDGYFSKDSLGHEHLILADYIIPQIKNSSGIITDTMNWTKISGQYIATGTERYFAIGNFYNFRFNSYVYLCNPDTAKINHGGADQWPVLFRKGSYYIDDVAIWECGLPEYPADAGPDKQICRGDEVEIGAMELRDDYFYFWSDRSWFGPRNTWDTIAITPTLKVSPAKTTTYYLWCVDFKWEHTYDSVTVYVEECDINLVIPNVFTPNGDGINDYFMIGNPNRVNYIIDVFSRWGTHIFRGNQNYFWDGNSNGAPAPDGTYFYVIRAVNEDASFRKEFNGSVTILR